MEFPAVPTAQRAAFLMLVDRIVRRFTEVNDLSALGTAIDEVVDQITEVERAGFYVLEPGTRTLRLLHVRGFTAEGAREAERTAWDRHPGLVVRTGRIIDITDVEGDDEDITSSSKGSSPVRSRLWVPVYDEGCVVGAFGMASARPHAFGEMHTAALLLLASVTSGTYRRVVTDAALRRSDSILSAVAASSELLLCGIFDNQCVQRVLAHLGEATVASRVYVFENFPRESDGVICTRQRYEWTGPGVLPQIDNPALQCIAWAEDGYGRWAEMLPRNEPIVGLVEQFPPDEWSLLEPQGILALAAVPVFVGSSWWGMIGFDDCVAPRVWTPQEIDALKAAARVFGAAIQRSNSEVELLRRSEEQRLLLDNIETHIFYLLDEHTYGAVNRAHASAAGLTPTDFDGRKISDVLGDAVAAVCAESNRRAFQERRRIYSEEWVPSLDGEPRLMSVIKSPWIDDTGKVAFVVASADDVTDARRVQRELVEARADLEQKVVARTRELQDANQKLTTEIAERRRMESQILAHREQLRALASELFLTEERERRRFATLLHDHVGQTLSLARIQASFIGRNPSTPEEGRSLTSITQLLDEAIRETRTLTFELSPPILYELGLVPALEWLADRASAQGIAPAVTSEGEFDELSNDERIVVFEAARELLMNVIKHSRASNVRVHVTFSIDGIDLEVVDDGAGFADDGAPRSGFGLFSLRERLEALGGSLVVLSTVGKGTRATAKVRRTPSQARGNERAAS